MTTATLEDYLRAEAKIAKMPDDVIEKRVQLALKFGLADFWMSYRWNFRVKVADVTITGGDTEQDKLPKDFGAMKSISETDSTNGWNLDFLEKEKYDEVYPKPSSIAGNTPNAFTIYFDQDENRAFIQLAPIPTAGTTLPMTYYSKPPEEIDYVPIGYEAALIPSCVKFLYRWGSTEQVAVARQQFLSIKDLVKRDAVTYRKLKTLAHNIKKPTLLYKEGYIDTWLQ